MAEQDGAVTSASTVDVAVSHEVVMSPEVRQIVLEQTADMLELYERTLAEKRTYRDEVKRLTAELAQARTEIERLTHALRACQQELTDAAEYTGRQDDEFEEIEASLKAERDAALAVVEQKDRVIGSLKAMLAESDPCIHVQIAEARAASERGDTTTLEELDERLATFDKARQ